MGKEAATTTGGISQEQTKRGRGRPPKDTTNDTASGRQAGGQPAGGQPATGKPAGKEDIEVIHGLAAGVDSPPPSIPEPEAPKRGRGRPKGSTNKARSTPAKKKAVDVEQTKYMIQTLLMVGFNISASRLGDHWKLTNDEASNLAEPIAAILDRHDLTDKMGAYGDYIALIAAIGMIVIPKAMVHMEISKQKRGGQSNVRNFQPKQTAAGGQPASQPDAAANDGSDRSVQREHTPNRPSDVKRSLAWLEG